MKNSLVKMDHNHFLNILHLKMLKLVHITPLFTGHNSFGPEITYNYGKGKINFKVICLKQDSVSFTLENVVY